MFNFCVHFHKRKCYRYHVAIGMDTHRGWICETNLNDILCPLRTQLSKWRKKTKYVEAYRRLFGVIFSHFPCEWHFSIIKNENWCAARPTKLFQLNNAIGIWWAKCTYTQSIYKYAWQQIKTKFLYLTNQKRLRFIGVEKYCLVKWCVRLPLFVPI